MRGWVLVAVAALAAACGHDLTGVGGGQILEFRNDLQRPVTFLYCPQQGCDRPLFQKVSPGESWRTTNQTINGSGAVSLQLGGRRAGCRLIPAVGVLVEPLNVVRATYVLGNPPCVRAPG
jgi:hypothetical protein